MWKRWIAWLAIGLLAAGCAPSRHFGQETPRPTPPHVWSFEPGFAWALKQIEPMRAAKEPVLTGDTPSLNEPLDHIGTSWHAYLKQLDDPRFQVDYPRPLKARPVGSPKNEAGVCRDGEIFPELLYPRYCPARHGGLLVYPAEPNGGLALPAGEDRAWFAVTVIAAWFYAQHLRAEMSDGVGVKWPQGQHFDSCVAGISLRALYAQDDSAVERRLEGAVQRFNDLALQHDLAVIDHARALSGFQAGRLEQCVL